MLFPLVFHINIFDNCLFLIFVRSFIYLFMVVALGEASCSTWLVVIVMIIERFSKKKYNKKSKNFVVNVNSNLKQPTKEAGVILYTRPNTVHNFFEVVSIGKIVRTLVSRRWNLSIGFYIKRDPTHCLCFCRNPFSRPK